MRAILMAFLLLAGIRGNNDALVLRAEISHKGLAQVDPESVGLLSGPLKNIDRAVEAAIQAGEIPGAVVLVGRHGRIAYLRAFGNRAVQPEQEAMTADTIFDIASLTKVLATAPSIMLLAEDGALRFEDKVKRYLPKFSGGGKDGITLRQLLTHYSGLPADFDLSRQWSGTAEALEELWKIKTNSDPGKTFAYSDLNYITLGEVVHVASGKDLNEFARERIFVPLGMTETSFLPPAKLVPRIAPTESRRNTLKYLNGQYPESMDQILRGEVHDPTAWRMDGIAGHAGIFSSAPDMAIFAQMMLDRGAYKGGRLFSPMSIQAMTSPQSPSGATDVRGFGWDLDSSYTSPRGDIFTGGYGHTGFTGTSLWIHPQTDTFIIILSNRVHPDGGKDINHLRGAIANIVAASIADPR